jgi:hypothetical protein
VVRRYTPKRSSVRTSQRTPSLNSTNQGLHVEGQCGLALSKGREKCVWPPVSDPWSHFSLRLDVYLLWFSFHEFVYIINYFTLNTPFTHFFPPCSYIFKPWSPYLLKVIQSKPVDPHSSTATSRLNWPPADLNGLVRFAGRPYMVSACVPLRFKRSIPRREHPLWIRPIRVCTWKFSMDSPCLRVGKRMCGF